MEKPETTKEAATARIECDDLFCDSVSRDQALKELQQRGTELALIRRQIDRRPNNKALREEWRGKYKMYRIFEVKYESMSQSEREIAAT
jgi:hypothetical protein